MILISTIQNYNYNIWCFKVFLTIATQISITLVVGEDDDEVRLGGVYVGCKSRK